MKFHDGNNVKLTFNSLDSSRTDSVKFKDLIKGNWNLILLSSYCTDHEWLIDQFDGISPEIEINLIEHYDRTREHAGIQRVTVSTPSKPRTLNFIHPPFPKFPNYGVMHCKLMLLASDEFMRIVVSSANLMDFDYEEVQNILFVQDLPKLKEVSLTATSASFLIDCQFYLALNRLLDILGVFNDKKIIMPMDLMQKYDWTGVKAKLVYSCPEYLSFNDINASGIVMLNRIVKEHFKGEDFNGTTIEYQGSSIGTIKEDWLDEFGRAATGKLFDHQKSTPSSTKKRTSSHIENDEDDKSKVIDLTDEGIDQSFRFKIVFPSLRTVENSLVGPQGFGTLFCKRKDFEPESRLFYDCVTGPSSEPCKYAMHSKIMTVISKNAGIVYVYCGSHNFTASAWGKSTKQSTMLMVSNFEVGVLIPKSEWTCRYPYLRPVPEYKADDFPWDQTAYHF